MERSSMDPNKGEVKENRETSPSRLEEDKRKNGDALRHRALLLLKNRETSPSRLEEGKKELARTNSALEKAWADEWMSDILSTIATKQQEREQYQEIINGGQAASKQTLDNAVKQARYRDADIASLTRIFTQFSEGTKRPEVSELMLYDEIKWKDKYTANELRNKLRNTQLRNPDSSMHSLAESTLKKIEKKIEKIQEEQKRAAQLSSLIVNTRRNSVSDQFKLPLAEPLRAIPWQMDMLDRGYFKAELAIKADIYNNDKRHIAGLYDLVPYLAAKRAEIKKLHENEADLQRKSVLSTRMEVIDDHYEKINKIRGYYERMIEQRAYLRNINSRMKALEKCVEDIKRSSLPDSDMFAQGKSYNDMIDKLRKIAYMPSSMEIIFKDVDNGRENPLQQGQGSNIPYWKQFRQSLAPKTIDATPVKDRNQLRPLTVDRIDAIWEQELKNTPLQMEKIEEARNDVNDFYNKLFKRMHLLQDKIVTGWQYDKSLLQEDQKIHDDLPLAEEKLRQFNRLASPIVEKVAFWKIEISLEKAHYKLITGFFNKKFTKDLIAKEIARPELVEIKSFIDNRNKYIESLEEWVQKSLGEKSDLYTYTGISNENNIKTIKKEIQAKKDDAMATT